MHILKIVREQNYFQFNQEYYKQIDGLAMGAPISCILVEIYTSFNTWNIHKYTPS
jgi:hypothetical protein